MIWQAVTYMISDHQLEYTISKVSPPSGENEKQNHDGAKSAFRSLALSQNFQKQNIQADKKQHATNNNVNTE